MTRDQILVALGGLAVIGFIAWFFWLKGSPGVKASVVSDGNQEQMILVKGGYMPDTICVAAGRPAGAPAITARRDRGLLRAGDTGRLRQVRRPSQVVPVEFVPGEPGSHTFTCQMGMLRGQIVVEAA